MSAFDELGAIPPQLLADGWLARVVLGGQLTMAVVEAEPGAVLPEHHHHNEQFGMVIRGTASFRVGDEEQSVGAGGIWRIPSDTPHAVTGTGSRRPGRRRTPRGVRTHRRSPRS